MCGLAPQKYIALHPCPAPAACLACVPCSCPRCLPALSSPCSSPPLLSALLSALLSTCLFLRLLCFLIIKVRQPLSLAYSAIKLWTAEPMDSTRKTYSISGTIHKCNSSTTISLPSAILKLTKPASAQRRGNIPTCPPRPHRPLNTLPLHSQPHIHNTRTSITKHPLHMDHTTMYRVGNGQVNPNTIHHAP